MPRSGQSVHPPDAAGAPDRLCARLRWPDDGTPSGCPRCGSSDIATARDGRRWRCRDCRRYFTATTGTALQGSRLDLAAWVEASRSWWSGAGDISRHFGVSYPTARRMARLLELAESSPGDRRLEAMLRLPPGAADADTDRRGRALRPGADGHSAELAGLPRREKEALQVLASIPDGATVGRVAEYSGMSPGHARRCLRRLMERGQVRREVQQIRCGYRRVPHTVWRLAHSLGEAPAMTLPVLHAKPLPPPKSIPVEFWWVFWSGHSAADIDLGDEDECLEAAGRLVACSDPTAKYWALYNLPVGVIRRLRGIRGYDSGPISRSIDAVLADRDAA